MSKTSLTKFIHLIGVELEGGWERTPPDVSQIGHDGSVHVQARYVGEIASPPMAPKEGLEWVKRNHPTATNETCGLHVHISFKRMIDYARLADDEAARIYLIERLTEWGKKTPWGEIRPEHPFWPRLKGMNRFCTTAWNPTAQIPHRGKNEHRYSQMNFCWGLHKTVEVRVLPAFLVPDVSVAAIEQVLMAISEYLAKVAKETKEVSKRIQPDVEEPENPRSSASADIEPPPLEVFGDSGDLVQAPFATYGADDDWNRPPFTIYHADDAALVDNEHIQLNDDLLVDAAPVVLAGDLSL